MNSNYKTYLKTLAILGCVAVVIGAFGAHFLKERLSISSLGIYQTGVQYHFYHTLAALIAAVLLQKTYCKKLIWSIRFFILGVLLFSGSLYLLAIRHWLEMPGLTIVGPITPIGGLFFMLGWVFLFLSFSKRTTAKPSNEKIIN